jgi:hypothetical protein
MKPSDSVQLHPATSNTMMANQGRSTNREPTMFRKTIFAAAAVAVLAAGATASTAQAKAHWDVNIDLGGYGSYPTYPDYPVYPVIDPPHHPHHFVDSYDHGISCNEGRWTVRSAGFRNVSVEECDGRSFTYTGKRHGNYFEIKVSRRSGDIIAVNAL